MRKSIAFLLSAAAVPALTAPAHAQQSSPPPADAQPQPGLGDIVVTATRRAERLQAVPIAVTAISGATLAAQQQTDVASLARTVPNLNVSPFTGDPTNATVSLRGQVASDNTPNIDPAVGIYLDGVYLARSAGANLNLIDVERVEALRGPQGTLFGRNTIGGAINVVPTRPSGEFEGWVEGSYGNYDAWKVTGVLNAPLAENVAARFVASHSEHDGFARSSLNGVDLASENLDYYRGTLRANVGDWEALLTGDYTKFTNDGQWVILKAATATGISFVNRVSGGRDSLLNYVGFTNRPAVTTTGPFSSEGWGGSFTLTGELGSFATLRSISAYRESHRSNNNNDLDGTPYVLLQQYIDGDKFDQHQFSQELQLFGKAFDSRLDWIVGAYYFREKGFLRTQARFLFVASPTATQNVTEGDDVINVSKSLFAQATFNVTDRLSVVGGVRHVWDTRNITLANRTLNAASGTVIACGLPALTAPPGCRVEAPRAKFDYTPFTVGLNFKATDDVLFYTKFARGFRSGGFNLRATSARALQPFAPERVDSYEVGAKLDVARFLRFNAAVYHSKFNDIQFQTIRAFTDPATGATISASIVENAGKAKVSGVELETTAQFGPLRLNASLGALDARYTEILPGVTGVTLNSPFQFTPDLTWSLGGDYKIEAGFGSVNLHADWSYKGDVAFAPSPPSPNSTIERAYKLLNAVVSLKLNDPRFDVSLWGRNLTNKAYNSRILDQSALGFLTGLPGDPRTYGVTARYTF